MPTLVTSPVGCPRFFVSQAVSSGLCPSTCVVPSRSVSSDLDTLTTVFELYVRLRERRQWDSDTCVFLGEFPIEPVTSEAHPYPHRLRPVRGRRTRIKYIISLTGLAEAFRHGWYQSKKFLVWLIEEIGVVEEMIRMKAPVPPVAVPPGDGEAIPIAPVPPRVEVPFVAPVPPRPPVLIAEEPVMQVEKFLRLQPPIYSGGPNPDIAEHWVHEIEGVFATMRCPAADRVVLAAYQLRGFALEWWRLKMQTTFAGRTEEAITWSEFLDVFNDTFFRIQVQQVKREQFRTLQQGNSSVLEYQMRFMALSRYAPYVVSDNNMMVEYFIRGLRVELQDAIVPFMCKTVEEAA
ncbi:hypothetical protein Taro_030157 [Colocasia esculenta]|uniref:Retrotransposon gag domain-containing protein n=1 Tax=Colocasia esculenta TaxID=4460 RepID=A0A843VZD9_COLES|nr:hypothetical protein [Colocasia esculenta]